MTNGIVRKQVGEVWLGETSPTFRKKKSSLYMNYDFAAFHTQLSSFLTECEYWFQAEYLSRSMKKNILSVAFS